MPKKIFLVNLDLPQYVGVAQGAKNSFGLPTKLFRIDYHGVYEIGTQKVDILPSLSNIQNYPKSISVSRIPMDKRKDEFSFFALDEFTNDINEKATLLFVLFPRLHKQIVDFEKQIIPLIKNRKNKSANLYLNDHTQYLLSQIELYFYLLKAILDLFAKLSKLFNQKASDKFGKQLHLAHTDKLNWDRKYQNYLKRQMELREWLSKYRNKFSHEFSLKVRFKQINKKWRTVISYDYYSTEGLVIPDSLEIIWSKFLAFASFFDNHFRGKLANLNIFSKENFL